MLLLVGSGIGWEALVHEVVVAGQLTQAILPPKLIETWHAMLAVTNQIERRNIDLPGRSIEPRQMNVLHELWMVVQSEQPQTLPAQAQTPVRHPPRSHCVGGFALERIDHGDFLHYLVRVLAHIAVLDQVGNQRVQAVHGDEFFGEVEWRSEMIHAAIDVVRIGDVIVWNHAAEAKDSRSGGEDANTIATPS